MFQIGELIQNVRGASTKGQFDLETLRGQWVVLYFYPKDNTSACTLEAKEFSAAKDAFAALNAAVVGISRDSVKTHEGFCARQELSIELVSDKSEELCTLFDVIKPKIMYGKPCRGIVRSTFLIDPQGHLAFEWRGVKVPGHVQAVQEKIQELSQNA